MSHSTEVRLAEALKPVEAPSELWNRVDAALPANSDAPRWPRFAMAAALAALMSGGVLYLRAQQQPLGEMAPATFASSAIALHTHPDASPAADYAVQRYVVAGQPVTVVSLVDKSATGPKQVRAATTDAGPFAISEWRAGGRRWAVVSDRAAHKQACTVCHRA